MPYELFEKKRTHGGPPAVTVTKYGTFVLNSAAVDQLQKRPYLQVFWNKDEGKIAFKPLKSNESNAYHVNYSPRGGVGSISGTAFLKHVGYKYDETKSFSAEWNEREGLLEVQLLDRVRGHRR